AVRLPGPTDRATKASGIAPEVIGWGTALYDNVKGSVLSLSGNFELPRIDTLARPPAAAPSDK
ncbi:MAG TPA: hypothetical protein VJ598_03400, partial [Albitalea sp.]|nr:hypothetical protein [Albitalea sp.]